MFTLLCLFASVALVSANPANRDKIPNGNLVPDPCHAGQTWQPVGHSVSDVTLAGAANVNTFGQDFKAAMGTWTTAFCQKDSDGDGNSNGVELGDPQCTWKIGDTPSGKPTGHPGINEKTVDCSGIVG